MYAVFITAAQKEVRSRCAFRQAFVIFLIITVDKKPETIFYVYVYVSTF